jgi:hypothetical protein
MRKSSKMLLVLTVVLAGMTAQAQRIYPGSKYVNNVIFTSFSVNYKLSLIVAGRTLSSFGQMKDELRTTTLSGRKVIVRVQSYSDGSLIDTSIADASTYAPIYYSGVKAQRKVQLNFTGSRVSGKDSSNSVDMPMSKPVFYSGFYDLLVRGALLHTGYQESMPVYSNDIKGETSVTVNVLRDEKLPGQPDAWVVETQINGTKTTMWIEKVNRGVLRQVTDLTGNSQLLMEPI